jgi:uncharacterized coiled-coil protein SlyX
MYQSDMSNNHGLEEKIISLESRLAFTEDLITGLNAEIAEQNKELHGIKVYCRELKKKIDELSEADSSDLNSDQKPPHY